ncbi:hypothetical protein PR048_004474 [Dryococelus australis]|uniref:Uncharacterized protein n=1 Tax=Dryococelus australis TaxID=614101 RepID=A0ABQ9I5J7_9NEOP|nr:hypothetical protein PR048_004474 [Dryococelus australis]
MARARERASEKMIRPVSAHELVHSVGNRALPAFAAVPFHKTLLLSRDKRAHGLWHCDDFTQTEVAPIKTSLPRPCSNWHFLIRAVHDEVYTFGINLRKMSLPVLHDKIDFKNMYTEVTFGIGSEFITLTHALDDSTRIAAFQRNTKGITHCQMWAPLGQQSMNKHLRCSVLNVYINHGNAFFVSCVHCKASYRMIFLEGAIPTTTERRHIVHFTCLRYFLYILGTAGTRRRAEFAPISHFTLPILADTEEWPSADDHNSAHAKLSANTNELQHTNRRGERRVVWGSEPGDSLRGASAKARRTQDGRAPISSSSGTTDEMTTSGINIAKVGGGIKFRFRNPSDMDVSRHSQSRRVSCKSVFRRPLQLSSVVKAKTQRQPSANAVSVSAYYLHYRHRWLNVANTAALIGGSIEQRRKGAGETGDLREYPPTSGIVRHDSHLQKFGYPTEDYITCVQADLKQEFRKCLFYREQRAPTGNILENWGLKFAVHHVHGCGGVNQKLKAASLNTTAGDWNKRFPKRASRNPDIRAGLASQNTVLMMYSMWCCHCQRRREGDCKRVEGNMTSWLIAILMAVNYEVTALCVSRRPALSKIGSKIYTENCCTIRIQSLTGGRDEVHFKPPKLEVRNLDPRSAAIVDKCSLKIRQQLELRPLVFLIKLDPGSEPESFDLGPGKMLVQPDISAKVRDQARDVNNAHEACCYRLTDRSLSILRLSDCSGWAPSKISRVNLALKVVHGKVSTFENRPLENAMPLTVYILTGTLTAMVPNKVGYDGRKTTFSKCVVRLIDATHTLYNTSAIILAEPLVHSGGRSKRHEPLYLLYKPSDSMHVYQITTYLAGAVEDGYELRRTWEQWGESELTFGKEQTTRQGEPGSIPPVGSSPDFLLWESSCTMPLVGWTFSGISRLPRPCIPALIHTHLTLPSSDLKTSLLRLRTVKLRRREGVLWTVSECNTKGVNVHRRRVVRSGVGCRAYVRTYEYWRSDTSQQLSLVSPLLIGGDVCRGQTTANRRTGDIIIVMEVEIEAPPLSLVRHHCTIRDMQEVSSCELRGRRQHQVTEDKKYRRIMAEGYPAGRNKKLIIVLKTVQRTVNQPENIDVAHNWQPE